METQPIPTFRVLGRKHPLDVDAIEAHAPVGMSIREIIPNDETYFVALDDHEVPADDWADCRPAPGSTVHVVPLPGDDSMRTLLLTAALISAAVFGGGALAAHFAAKGGLLASEAFWSSAIMAVGSLTMTALVVPPRIDR